MTVGQMDWKNIGTLLKSHESSPEHTTHMKTWKDLEIRLRTGMTLDQAERTLLEAEKRRWRDVLTRLIAIIHSLAERNLALRGSANTIYQDNNGNFLKEVELLARFDPVMKQHVDRVESGQFGHSTYLGNVIQNELIASISGKMLNTMVSEIKQSKYYSIILDCTPDLSHQEQMSVVIRIVHMAETPEIKEHFLGFLVASQTTGLDLSVLILNRLEELNIPFDDCRGQSYDNGANMKGRNKGVQARLLEKNPRALYVPCGAHTLNLVVADAAKSSTDAISYFGSVQKLYNLFSASPQRWAILKEHVTLTLKSWSETRWESRINSIEAVRYQAPDIREALLVVRDKATDSLTKVEAQALAEEVGSYRFLICTVVWYDILHQVNHVSKLLQSSTMQLDVAANLLMKAQTSLSRYRVTGFCTAQATAKDLCDQMNVEAVLKEKRLRSTRTHFCYESPDEPISDAMRRLEVTFFNVVVDITNESIKDRFETLDEVRAKFGVLINFKKINAEAISQQCDELCCTLGAKNEKDLDGKELAQEINNLPDLPSNDMTALELLAYISKKQLKELYPNLWIALRIACTLPVTVASAERSFSKLKLIKNYLRSSMGQDRLSGLAIISINQEIGKQLSYDDIIDDFASKKARRQHF